MNDIREEIYLEAQAVANFIDEQLARGTSDIVLPREIAEQASAYASAAAMLVYNDRDIPRQH